MASLSIPYDNFVAGTTIVSQQVDDNNAAIVDYINDRNAGSANWEALSTTGAFTSTLTTNQIILGTTNTVTITAPAPSASRVLTIPDPGAAASFVMTAGTQTISDTKTFDGQLIGKGTPTNDAAAAGYIGEYIESVITSDTNFPATGEYGDLTSISLTAGDWDVWTSGTSKANGATVVHIRFGISATSGNSAIGLVSGDNLIFTSAVPTAATDSGMQVPPYRVSLSGTTTYYLKFLGEFSAATPQAIGKIAARRVR